MLAQTIVLITGHVKCVYVLFIDERNIWHTPLFMHDISYMYVFIFDLL
jgi:hypothetical protein